MSTVSLPAHGQVWEETLAAVNRRPLVLILLLGLFAGQISNTLYPTPDAIGYLSIARNLGQLHVLANRGNPQLYYPIGYPLLISPLFVLGDRPFLLLSAVHAGLALAFLAGVYVWTRRCLPTAAVWLTLLTAVNIDVMGICRRPLSENAFLAVLIALVNVLDPLASDRGRRPLGRTMLASLLMILLAAIRPAGITVAAGFGLFLALAARRGQIRWTQAIARGLAVGLPATIVLGGLIAYDKAMAHAAAGVSYLDQIIDSEQTLPGQLLEGLRLRISEVGRLAVPGMFKAYGIRGDWLNPNMLIYVPLFALFWIGWVKFLRRRSEVLAWTVPFYLALHTLWPYDQAGRFFLPLLPLLLACLWMALSPLRAYQFRVAALLVAAHLAVSLGYWLGTDEPRARAEERRWPAVDHFVALIRSDYHPVAAAAALGDTWLFLNYALDRPVRLQPEDAPVAPDVTWLIVPREAPPRQEFAPVAVRGDCQLWRRRPLTASPAPTRPAHPASSPRR